VGRGDLERLQRDVVEPTALAMRDYLLYRLHNPTPEEPGGAVVQALAEWDGRHAADSAGALAFELTLAHLMPALCSRDMLGLYGSTWMARNLIARMLRAAPQEELQPAWRDALVRAARGLARWRVWGAAHRLRLAHVLSGIPIVGRRYVLADVPAEGGNETLCKMAHGLDAGRHRVLYGSMARHVSDLSDLDANSFVLLGGQDGWIGSDTALDQLALWQRGAACTVPLRPETVRRTFRHRTVLMPRAVPRGG
jgi:penicillin amidase